jgi:hypothetical protein
MSRHIDIVNSSKSAAGSVFLLSETKQWEPLFAGARISLRLTHVTMSGHYAMLAVTESSEHHVIDIHDRFEWIPIEEDFCEGHDPGSGKRIGVYFSDRENATIWTNTMKDAVLHLIAEKSANLPVPKNLRNSTKLIYDETSARFIGLPSTWSSINRQFGRDYESIPKSIVQGYPTGIASVLVMLQYELKKNGGLEMEGIFRVSADANDCNLIKDQINTGSFSGCSDPHVCASLIKIYFRDLPIKVFDLCAEACIENSENCLIGLSCVREPYRSLILWFLDFMAEIVSLKSRNKMSANALATVFAPNLFTIPLDSNAMTNTQKNIALLTNEVCPLNSFIVLPDFKP